MAYARAALGNQAMGYWRGEQFQYGGDGSGMGKRSAGAGLLTSGQGGFSVGGQSWEPSILYMLGLIVLEMIVFGVLGRILK